MTSKYEVENLLRPPVELLSGLAGAACVSACVFAPEFLLMSPAVSYVAAATFAGSALHRFRQAGVVVRYQRALKRLPRYELRASQIPSNKSGLFLGRGFEWKTKHTERYIATLDSRNERYITRGKTYRFVRSAELALERRNLMWLAQLTRSSSILNPFRPDPDVGGSPAIHGVGMDRESDIYQLLSVRSGHTAVIGTTGVGKTRTAELYITQDIHRGGNCVIVIDPKGDSELLRRCYVEAARAGRADDFWLFHLGYPEHSCKYNGVGTFSRITEVPTRLTGNLPESGDAKSFKDFAWQFTKFISIAEVRLGRKPTYQSVKRHLRKIDGLFIDYAEYFFEKYGWPYKKSQPQAQEPGPGKKNKGKDPRGLRIAQYIQDNDIYDDVLNDLLYMFEMDRDYYGKISIQLGPVLEKLTTGKIGEVLSPDYSDDTDKRRTIDFQEIIKRNGICYIGLDALTDPEVATAVGEAMFSELTATAGYIYKHGINSGSPIEEDNKTTTVIHGDEFSDLIGPKFSTLINKSRGAGYQMCLYTQTVSDITAKLESEAKTGQVLGNINHLVMLRVQEPKTAELLTRRLPEVKVRDHVAISGYSDQAESHKFISSNQDRTQESKVPLLTAAEIMSLPIGQSFVLMNGNKLYKTRAPKPLPEKGESLPENIQSVIDEMSAQDHRSVDWERMRDGI